MWIELEDSAFSQELEGLTLPSVRGLEQSPIVKETDIATVFYCPECDKVTLIQPPSGTTLPLCKEVHVDPLKSSSAGSHNYARTFQLQAAEKAWRESEADYSSRSHVSLAKFDLNSSSWKTYQRSLIADWEPLPESLPDCGMTVDGVFYPLQMWERHTLESDGFCLPTPGASMGGGETSGNKKRPSGHKGQTNLTGYVKMWPTPTEYGNYNRKGASKNSGDGLATAVKNWPTPTARAGQNPGQHGQGGQNLATEVGGQLNPTFVEWLMGYPKNWTEVIMPVKGWVSKKIRKAVMKDKCEVCDGQSGLGLHHRDEDRKNNAPENLATVCASCHTKEHWKTGKQPWRIHPASCTVCGKSAKRLGLCETHRSRFLRHGSPYLKKIKIGQSWQLVEEHGVQSGPTSQGSQVA